MFEQEEIQRVPAQSRTVPESFSIPERGTVASPLLDLQFHYDTPYPHYVYPYRAPVNDPEYQETLAQVHNEWERFDIQSVRLAATPLEEKLARLIAKHHFPENERAQDLATLDILSSFDPASSNEGVLISLRERRELATFIAEREFGVGTRLSQLWAKMIVSPPGAARVVEQVTHEEIAEFGKLYEEHLKRKDIPQIRPLRRVANIVGRMTGVSDLIDGGVALRDGRVTDALVEFGTAAVTTLLWVGLFQGGMNAFYAAPGLVLFRGLKSFVPTASNQPQPARS